MMMSEFTERTGFEPTAEEYAEIEEQYYKFDGDKDAFCRHWKKNVGVEGICEARAAKIAQADEFIREMPQGYDTIVGERGLGLSGGQKQRVALARAILYDPKILIMDDATSAVDMETEAEIQEALRSVMKGRTTFIIAHRISSVRRADLIVCLENGRIAERGTHAELLAAGGLYAQMYADQTRDFAGGEN